MYIDFQCQQLNVANQANTTFTQQGQNTGKKAKGRESSLLGEFDVLSY